MRKVAFYIDNSTIADVDVSEIKKGNPGIGGTEHLILLVSSLLSERGNGLDVTLYVRKEQQMPSLLKCEKVDSVSSAIHRAEQEKVNILVLKHDASNIVEDVFHAESDLQVIVWCHVFICYWELDYYAKNKLISKVVFVGREMQDLYRDHRVFKKSTFIYNCVSLGGCREKVEKSPYSQRRNIVTYVGSIVPFKGLHLLAKAWPKVIAEIPDAQLYIIGSGKLYNAASRLGKFGIAEASYEKKIMKYLSIDGQLIPSVHFMGRMGTEKDKILLQTKVGVPNPSGITETFCLSAVEMQSFGVKIATIKSPGYLDTVKNGILYSSPSALAETIIFLLRTGKSEYDKAMSYFERMFSYEAVIGRWEKLLNGNDLPVTTARINMGYRLKWLKEIIRIISDVVPINRVLPPVERILIFFERRILYRVTFMDSNLTV